MEIDMCKHLFMDLVNIGSNIFIFIEVKFYLTLYLFEYGKDMLVI